MEYQRIRRVGYDMGRVLFKGTTQDRRLPGGGFGIVPGPNPGMMELMERSIQALGPKNVFVVSWVPGDDEAAANWRLLRHYGAFQRGLLPANTYIFPGSEDDRAKKAVYVKSLGITDFVDDRILEVLLPMPPCVRLHAFTPDPAELEALSDRLGGRELIVSHSAIELARHLGL